MKTDAIYVTADGIYSDIDIYACSIAYAELLCLKGENAIAVVNTSFAESIPKFLLDLHVTYTAQEDIKWNPSDRIIILDRSDTEGILKYFAISQIIEIYDHHYGYEDFWREKLGDRSHIEPVGSCATLMWEQIKQSGLERSISNNSKILLYAAIISNTLNFRASVTTTRDISAAKELIEDGVIDQNFVGQYFSAVTTKITKAPFESVLKDVKTALIHGKNLAIGQLELWEIGNITDELLKQCSNSLPNYPDIPWFITISSIKDGTNTLISKSTEAKRLLAKALHLDWDDSEDSIKLPYLILRKEIIKKLLK